MSPPIHTFRHHAMATYLEVRIAGEEKTYAAQAAQAVFALADQLEIPLSKFREEGEIRQLSRLAPGESLRVGEPVYSCLKLAKDVEASTFGAFSISATAVRAGQPPPSWSLREADSLVLCHEGKLEFDLGAIGKGFALDRMAAELAEWECDAFLLIAGGSSVLAGNPPADSTGWDVGLGGDSATRRLRLSRASMSGSGTGVQGRHIFDPRTGMPATLRNQAWVVAPSAALSDALSTACMVLTAEEIAIAFFGQPDRAAFLDEAGARFVLGERPLDFMI